VTGSFITDSQLSYFLVVPMSIGLNLVYGFYGKLLKEPKN